MLIAIEGIDGVGKTTVARRVSELLPAHYVKFPDRTTETGKKIDAALRGAPCDPLTFQALQVCNRLERLNDLRDAAKGSTTWFQGSTTWFQHHHMVCDRYLVSALVYGGQDFLPESWLAAMTAPFPRADLNVLLLGSIEKIDGERLAGRDREIYEQRGAKGLLDQQQRFSKIWSLESQVEGTAIWRLFRTDVQDAEEIAGHIVGAVKAMCSHV